MSAEARRGLVLSVESGRFTVESGDNTFFCRSGTRVRKSEGRLVAGDRVLFSVGETGEGFITDIEPRKNRLTRPPAANIDLLAIAVAPREPQPYLYNIDLLTVIAQKHGIECAIILTKCDLGGGERILDIYSRTPYPVIATGTGEGSGIAQAKDLLRGKICVLCGASGVGKSTLINRMYGELNLKTGELSARISRGKNTTRTTRLFPLGEGTYLADTPGFTALDIMQYADIRHEELFGLFPEFAPYFGGCRYPDCTHTKETECAILDSVKNAIISESRYESYKKLYAELKSIDRYK